MPHAVTADTADTADSADAASLHVVCPRCGTPARQRFYGPCAACRSEMRNQIGNEAREIVTEAYEPKMNVTPNAVATKD